MNRMADRAEDGEGEGEQVLLEGKVGFRYTL